VNEKIFSTQHILTLYKKCSIIYLIKPDLHKICIYLKSVQKNMCEVKTIFLEGW